ncbi:Uncharacterized Fe-S cluster protein YjdI [Methylomagnum ishizawai]|uniref:Uncharacterized Fe-S cluster protein YjdI n=1 Tax=Methylomagnum ishizawai TaxID=1760988 RepID=A0A1Y6D643_9GAMM|nr:(4Fe-4S)-binding protein [Methylomagnum ishizawai]SMF96323.1 Uncharacterized Fe-S cluster protein YjdI [Methylomagnum ishizawai]
MQEYKNRQVIVRFNPYACSHAGECVRGLPQVFDPSKEPWIDVDAATPEAIAEVVECCPSGALSYEYIVAAE